ncbi:MAG: hypothetical protein WDN72_02930 [Alphaproteobacteria bacterium]
MSGIILWGPKTIAWFDVWSIDHFVTGVNLYFFVLMLHARFRPGEDPAGNRFSIWGWVLALCFAWEALEHYLEVGLAGAWLMSWLQGVEFSVNRLITDPLMIGLGAWTAQRYGKLNRPAKIFSTAWIVVHLCFFPDSMYLQRFLPIIRL